MSLGTRDTFVDIFKISIEGGEFNALATFLGARAAEGDVLPVGQLQLEIHARDGKENFEHFARWWATLEAAGLRPFWAELNLVYINIVSGVRPELAEVSHLFRCLRLAVNIPVSLLQYSFVNFVETMRSSMRRSIESNRGARPPPLVGSSQVQALYNYAITLLPTR